MRRRSPGSPTAPASGRTLGHRAGAQETPARGNRRIGERRGEQLQRGLCAHRWARDASANSRAGHRCPTGRDPAGVDGRCRDGRAAVDSSDRPPNHAADRRTARQQHVHDLVSGDLLPHTSVIDMARAYAAGGGYDFTPMFWAVGPSSPPSTRHVPPRDAGGADRHRADGSYPDYGVPAQIAPALAASGFDRCSVASNHSLDKGEAGMDSTLDALDAAGLGHAGMARTRGRRPARRCSTSGARPWPTCRTPSGSTAGACPPSGRGGRT